MDVNYKKNSKKNNINSKILATIVFDSNKLRKVGQSARDYKQKRFYRIIIIN